MTQEQAQQQRSLTHLDGFHALIGKLPAASQAQLVKPSQRGHRCDSVVGDAVAVVQCQELEAGHLGNALNAPKTQEGQQVSTGHIATTSALHATTYHWGPRAQGVRHHDISISTH